MSEELTEYSTDKTTSPETIKKQEINQTNIEEQITSLIPLAGTIELTKEQEEILYAPVDPNMVEIRPDGLIYLPWMEYVTRLRRAFGMSWSLIPYGPPKKLGNFIHWAFWLIIRGKPYAFAVGEQRYFENASMTYGDALEGAKSNALMRLCKGIGISLELWQPEFRRKWIPIHAESYLGTGKDAGKTLWRKKGIKEGNGHDEVIEGEISESKSPASPSEGKQESVPITDQQKKLLFAKLKEKNIPLDNLEGEFKKHLKDFNKFPDVNNALDWIGKQKAQ